MAEKLPLILVPSLHCNTLEQAQTALPNGLTLGGKATATTPDPACQPGTIIAQDPAAGDQVKQGTLVNVTLNPSTPTTVTLDDYTCVNFSKAKSQLKKLGLVVAFQGTTTPLAQCPNPNFVALQDPAPGTVVPGRQYREPLHGFRSEPVDDREPVAVTEYVTEPFTPQERATLEPFVSNLDGPVFALTNLPEAVKGAMFARYSRTTKSLRRLFLDEFADDVLRLGTAEARGWSEKAAGIYERVFVEYGDDSVAQLGGVHLACEQSSQLLAKALEWGRLAAYLEQSTRYMRYDDKPGGRWRATVPSELEHTPLADTYAAFLDDAFTTYGELYERLEPWFKERFPKQPDDTDFVYRQTMLAKTCDTLRMLLPAGTRSNLGIYATGQSYEQLLMRLAQHPLAEMRDYGELMLVELRAVIPEFLKRVDQPERGVAWSDHWKAVRERTDELAAKLVGDVDPEPAGWST